MLENRFVRINEKKRELAEVVKDLNECGGKDRTEMEGLRSDLKEVRIKTTENEK